MGIDEIQKNCTIPLNALMNGIIIIAAPGNGENGDVLYPAKYNEVISVGALNKGGSLLIEDIAVDNITVLAPEKKILTTYSSKDTEDKYISADGSSPATAIVSGAIALVLWQHRRIKYFTPWTQTNSTKVYSLWKTWSHENPYQADRQGRVYP